MENYLLTFSTAVIRPIRIVYGNTFFWDTRIYLKGSSLQYGKDTFGIAERKNDEKCWFALLFARHRSSTSLNRYRFIRRVPFRLPSFERDCTLASLIPLFFFVPVYAGQDTHANSIPFWNLGGKCGLFASKVKRFILLVSTPTSFFPVLLSRLARKIRNMLLSTTLGFKEFFSENSLT